MKDLRRTVHCARPRGYGEGSSSILFLPGQASLRHKVGAAYLFDDRAGEGGEEGEGFEVSRKYCARLVICWAGFIIEHAESRGVQGIGIE